MEANMRLFGDLSQVLNVKKDEDAKRLLKILRKYRVSYSDSITDYKSAVQNFVKSKRLEGLSESTLSYYNEIPIKFGEKFNFKPVEEYTKQDIKNFLTYFQKFRKAGRQTTYVFYRVVCRFFKWCEEEKIISESPCKGVKYKHGKSERHYIPDEDVKKIRKACKTLFEKTIIEFLLTTGCRLGEFEGIKLTDVDFSENTVKVTGKGNKTRTVMFDDKTKQLLLDYLKECTDKKHLFALEEKGKKRGIQRNDIVKVVKNVVARTDINYSVCVHMFRHTFATQCLAKGMDITSISKLLGHSNLSTTQIYAEMNLENLKKNYRRTFSER